jgi:anti-sigma factor RsiW
MSTMRDLQTYLDSALDETSAHRVAAHLEDCRRCGLEAQVYREIKVALAGGRPPVDAELLERIRHFGEHLAARGDPSAESASS